MNLEELSVGPLTVEVLAVHVVNLLTVVLILLGHTYIKTHQSLHLNHGQFILWWEILSKAV